ncbi:MAG: helicase-related protein, partial [Halobaculum sp.]
LWYLLLAGGVGTFLSFIKLGYYAFIHGEYDGYVETVDQSLDAHDIDNFGGDERERLQGLLYPESVRDEQLIIASYGDRLRTLSELTEDGWRVVVEVLREASPVDALIHRNTRDTLRKYEQAGLLDETVPDRNPEQHEIQLSDEIRAVYDRIDEYTRKFYKLAQQSDEAESRAIGFVMTTYRQRLTSSIHAIAKSLTGRLDRLRERREVLEQVVAAQDISGSVERSGATQRLLDTMSEQDLDWSEAADELEADLRETDLTEILPGGTEEGLDLLDEEIAELESFVGALRRIDHDPKIDRLKDDIRDLELEGHNRIIIFTQYTDTMDFVRDELVSTHGEAVATYSGRGGSVYDAEKGWRSVGKERVKREFASDGEIDVLVCTDSASEGLNLQTCGALINYDLPWNPMRVEQRIGRIDRIGQKYEEITILNYSYADTVETEIYDRLDNRIDLFEDVVGEMQPVLSGVNSQIRSATMEADTESRAAVVEEADNNLAE